MSFSQRLVSKRVITQDGRTGQRTLRRDRVTEAEGGVLSLTHQKRIGRLGRPPGGNSEETRQRIIDAAMVCFADRGYEGATNKEIATRARITHGAIYHYFNSKAELFVACAEAVTAKSDERYEAAARGEASLRDRLDALVRSFVDLVFEEPAVAKFLLVWSLEVERRPEIRQPRKKILHQTLKSYADLAAQAKARGEIRLTVDPVAFGNALRSMLFGLASLAPALSEKSALRAAGEVLSHLVQGEFFLTERAPI